MNLIARTLIGSAAVFLAAVAAAGAYAEATRVPDQP